MKLSKQINDFIAKNQQSFCSQDVTIDSSGQSKKFDDKGNQIYVFPSYGWDGGNAITVDTINLKKIESLDVFSGPCADIYVKIEAALEAAVFYSYEGSDDAQVFVV